ncbi:YbaN family protein [Rhodobacter lacus]|uniref:YbaN family protein n=1 Tax=Rhodobacter lacus TaxID=1641972 RepID=A0ABW5AA14_9RHOB
MTQNGRAAEDSRGPRLVRAVFLILGLGFVALGFVGVFLPVLPTVPFLILAAGCFARSSERLEAWLLGHRHFGPMLRDWRARGAIPMRGKLMALAGSSLGMVLFVTLRHPGPVPIALVAAVMLGGLGYVFTRPTA